jgi:hypothetical protein
MGVGAKINPFLGIVPVGGSPFGAYAFEPYFHFHVCREQHISQLIYDFLDFPAFHKFWDPLL